MVGIVRNNSFCCGAFFFLLQFTTTYIVPPVHISVSAEAVNLWTAQTPVSGQSSPKQASSLIRAVSPFVVSDVALYSDNCTSRAWIFQEKTNCRIITPSHSVLLLAWHTKFDSAFRRSATLLLACFPYLRKRMWNVFLNYSLPQTPLIVRIYRMSARYLYRVFTR